MTGLTYDTGALVAAEHNDRRMWALHARALQRGILPTVPASVVVEAWRGPGAVGRLLEGCVVEALVGSTAREAGVLLGSCARSVGVADATVVEGALRRGDAVVTADRRDVAAVADGAGRRLAIIDV